RSTANRDHGDRRDQQAFEWQHRGTMISVMARSAYPLNTRVPRSRRNSVLRQISIILLVGLPSCSSPPAGPRLARDPSKTTELGLFMKTRVNPSFSKISFLLFHDE